jgi:hypothetical protein
MKFKASVRDPRTLAAVCHTSRGFQKKCIIKLHMQKLRFISSTTASDGSQAWTSCRTDSLLSEIRLESRNDNTIYFEVLDVGQLLQGLRCAERSSNVSMKLAKIDTRQVLKLTMQAQAAGSHDVSHDTAIRILSEVEIEAIVAPPLEHAVLQVALPSLSDVAAFVEKTRAAGCLEVTFAAKIDLASPSSNSLVISGDTFTASSSIRYSGVEHVPRPKHRPVPEDGEGGPEENEEELLEASVTVDIKKFGRFLAVKEVAPQRIILHLVPEKAVVLSAYAAGDTNLVFYIPSLQR